MAREDRGRRVDLMGVRSVWLPVWVAVPLLCFGLASLALAGTWAVLVRAPEERVMGLSQKIFYFHVPSAIAAYSGFVLVGLSSAAYLWTRRRFYDQWAHAGAEVGVVFTLIVLVTGPIWGRPAWGVWWSWDPRLTSTLILFLIYLGALVLRGSIPDPDRAARLCAVLGILGLVDIPIIHKSVEWWGGIHPGPLLKSGGLGPEMKQAFFVMFAAWMALFSGLVLLRVRLRVLEDVAAERRAEGGAA